MAGAGEDGGAVGVGVAVDQLDRLVEAGAADDREDGTEDLVGVDRHARVDLVDHRRPDPEAAAVDLELAAVDGQLGAGVGALADVVDDPLARLRRHHRSHFRAGVEAGADLDLTRPPRHLLDQVVGDLAGGDRNRDRHAALAGRAEAGGRELVGGVAEVSAGDDDRVVLRPAERLHPLAVLGRPGVDVGGDRGRANERDRRDVGVVQQRVDRDLVAVDDVEDARRQPRLGVELGDEVGGGGVALGGLQHKGVAAGDRDRVHPHRHHRREVERGDAGADAERLAEGEGIDGGRDLVGVLALQQLRDPAGELDHLEAAQDLALGVIEDLAVLGGDDPGELLDVGVEQLAEGEHHLGAAAERGLRPVSEGHARRRDRGVDVSGLGQHHLGLLFPGRRVPDWRGAGGGTARFLAADSVSDRPLRRNRAHWFIVTRPASAALGR